MTDDHKAAFVTAIEASLAAGTFVRLTLGKYRGSDEAQKIVATPVSLKDKAHLKFVTSFARRDVTGNFTVQDGATRISALLGDSYLSATLFTTTEDLTLSYTKKKATTLTRGKPTFTAPPASDHNRAKQYIVDASRPYLKDLGVTMVDGTVKPSMYPKFKQICHFIEIVDQLLRESDIRDVPQLNVKDIGAGKGYLTFALYDHLVSKLGKTAVVTGIDVRADMVKLCNDLARKSGFSGLAFEAFAAEKSTTTNVDMMIALHACDTATDDAIYQGIKANAALIVTAPCCQHELAPQISKAAKPLDGLMKFGLFKQRQADLVTDAVRCLLLESRGYKVKVIEFVSTEHTAKNILLAAIRDPAVDCAGAQQQFTSLKTEFGFQTQRLEGLLQR